MANYQFKLPDVGEGVTEGEIVEWHVKVGDVVAEDDPMVEVMTDKATVTIGAPRAGRIAAIHFDVGAMAQVGQVIVEIADADGAAEPARTPPRKSEPAATAVGDIREGLPGSNFFATDKPKANGNGAHVVEPIKPSVPRATPPAAGGGGLQAVDFFQAKPLATPAKVKLRLMGAVRMAMWAALYRGRQQRMM